MPVCEPLTILLVEDDPGHARLVEKNLRRAGISQDVVVMTDGYKACNFIFRQGEYAENKMPPYLLVVLDLNLPVLDGFRVLEKVKSDERTRHLPVVILTSTDDERDVMRCYKLGCNMFITKPVDYGMFSETIQQLGLFLNVVTFPAEE